MHESRIKLWKYRKDTSDSCGIVKRKQVELKDDILYSIYDKERLSFNTVATLSTGQNLIISFRTTAS